MDKQKLRSAALVYCLLALVAATFELWVGFRGAAAPQWAFLLLLALGLVTLLGGLVRSGCGGGGGDASGGGGGSCSLASRAVSVLLGAFYVYVGVRQAAAPSMAFSFLVALGILKVVVVSAVTLALLTLM